MIFVSSFSTGRLLRAWAALALVGALTGCVNQPGFGDIPPELQTASDETDDRKRARTRVLLATSYFQNGQTMVALDEVKKAIQTDPSFSESYNLAGLIYMAMGEQQLAGSNFQRAVQLNSRDGNAWHNLGWLQCQGGDYAAATQSFQTAIALPTYRERAKTTMAQGVCEARSGDLAKAEATLLRAYELDAGNPVTGYNLAKLMYQRGEFERARFYVRRLNNSEMANAESLWLGVRIERKLNNGQAMEQLASQLRRRFPESNELKAYKQGQFDD
ncbi:type IV pilus biogenesis/stability protein PilW [Ottowia sp.]|uniref:type IV pilus biogenesis/stability protein PilW n=1 Tax=Ottowia sp. TaxID=1898956 RepID=UPI003A897B44